jgi:uncharacterized membrane protein
MKKFFNHLRVHVIRGLLAIIPLALCYLTVKFVYTLTDKYIMGSVKEYFGYAIPGLGFVLVLTMLYIFGIIASNVLGKKFFKLIGDMTNKIPIIKTAYQVGRQISETLSLPEKQVFKKVVFVDYLKSGVWLIGFVTGTVYAKESEEELSKVFIPTVPNPTTGFVVLVSNAQILDPGWSVEDGIKMVVSGGIIGPETIDKLSRG